MTKIKLMRKLAIVSSAILPFVVTVQAFAQSPSAILISAPPQGYVSISNFINNVFQLVFAAAVLIVLVMLILGSIEWITSGGDKEAVAKARNRILNALIGLAVLAVAFALARLIAQFTGIDIFKLVVPSPNPSATATF